MLEAPQHMQTIKMELWCQAVEGWIFGNFFIDNFTTEHDTTKLIPFFHSESTAHSNDLNISYHENLPKIDENALIIDFAFHQKFDLFAMCSKH